MVHWLTHKIFIENYRGPRISEHKSWENCFREAEDRLGENGNHAFSSFLKQRRELSRLLSMPEVLQQSLKAEEFDLQVPSLPNLPLQYIMSAETDEEIASLKRENRLIKRVKAQLCKSSKLSQRGLCRKLGTNLSSLQAVLEILEWAHFIIWNRDSKTISIDAWNPQDDRLFLWREASSSPNLGPNLVKGQIHRCSEYNSRAIEEWIRTGAAELCESTTSKRTGKEGK